MNSLLEIKNLSVEYYRDGKTIPAVRGVSLELAAGKTLGVAGESGCGKSTVALSILGLIAPHEGRVTGGQIVFDGRNLTAMSESEWRAIRGKDVGIVFQDPFSSLNPVLTIGDQIEEAVAVHAGAGRANVRARALELLAQVRLPEPDRMHRSYPHQISGGQRQRAMIAMALANRPKLLVADEPTTALDVTVQKEILELLRALQGELGMSLLLITHHIGIISQYTEDLVILYGGAVMERGKTGAVIARPQHPYTQALLQALPHRGVKGKLATIPGAPPDLAQLPSGCIFHPRCPHVVDECKARVPELREIGPGRQAACHLAPLPPEKT